MGDKERLYSGLFQEEVTIRDKFTKFKVYYRQNGKLIEEVITFEKGKLPSEVLKLIKGCSAVMAID